jgi:predicted phage terminase large subunit-like protein
LVNAVRDAWTASQQQYGPLVSGLLLEDTPAGGNRHLKAALILRDPTLKGRIAMQPTEGKAKEERARRIAWFCEHGHVILLQAPWNLPLLDELTAFPYGAHDDMTDAFAYLIWQASGLASAAKKVKTDYSTTRAVRVVPTR